MLGGLGIFVQSAEGFHAVFQRECRGTLFTIAGEKGGEGTVLHHDDVGTELLKRLLFVLGTVGGEKIKEAQIADSVADNAVVVIERGEGDVAMGVLQTFLPEGLAIFDADGEGGDVFGSIWSGGGVQPRLVVFEEGRKAVGRLAIGATVEEHLQEPEVETHLQARRAVFTIHEAGV